MPLNETHDPQLHSWIESANLPGADFPIQNLPYGVFRRTGGHGPFRCGVAIGDQIVDLPRAFAAGVFSAGIPGAAVDVASTLVGTSLNEFMAAGPAAWSALRLALSRALRRGAGGQDLLRSCLLPQAQAEYALPAQIGDYTDFYTSIHHATAVGRLFRPDNPLLPNYKWLPVGYHGRCSSIMVSGHCVRRPVGQILPPGAATPILARSQRLDYEMELGVFIGRGNALGESIPVDEADAHVFGLCLLNDWSARDLQAWEYQPLGPFLGKNFATTISPWIVTLEALEPYRASWQRPSDDPPALSYLDSPRLRAAGAFDIQLEVLLQTDTMRQAHRPPCRLSLSSFRHAYWTVSHVVAHHTINGCNLRSGDLLGTGTQSGPVFEEAGSLLELSHGGRQPLTLPDGEVRRFLEDGDAVILRGWCERAGAARIGFGQAAGRVAAAD